MYTQNINYSMIHEVLEIQEKQCCQHLNRSSNINLFVFKNVSMSTIVLSLGLLLSTWAVYTSASLSLVFS